MLNAKKVMAFAALLPFFSLSISSVVAEYANNNYSKKIDNSYKEAVIDSNIIKFEAERDGAIIKMEWSNYNKDDFMYYKIMRSETHSNPVYPDQPAIKYLDNNDITEHKISNYSSKSAIYRICVISKEKDRYCSNTVKLEGFNKEEYKKNYKNTSTNEYKKEKTYAKKTQTVAKKQFKNIKENKSKLSDKMQAKINIAAEKFIKRIENKTDSNEKRIEIFEKIMKKLNSLAQKNSKYSDLVNHLNMKIKERIDSYEEDFSEIEKILNEAE